MIFSYQVFKFKKNYDKTILDFKFNIFNRTLSCSTPDFMKIIPNPGAGFLRIFTLAFDKLRVNDSPMGLENWAHRVRAGRNRSEATVKIRRNTAPGFIRLDPDFLDNLSGK